MPSLCRRVIERTINMEMLTLDQFTELKDAFKEAETDDTPYIGVKDDEIHVQGNPNNTEIKPSDYVVYFAFPNTEEWRARAKAKGYAITGKGTSDGRYFEAKGVFKNIYLTPRRVGAVVSTIAQIEQFMYQVTDNGEIKELSTEDIKGLLTILNGELSDATYDLVATVLRIPFDEEEWMLPMSTVETAVQIALNNPSAVNEADLFFDLPPDNR